MARVSLSQMSCRDSLAGLCIRVAQFSDIYFTF